MPVTREQLAEYVGELGLAPDQTNSLIETLLANDKAGTQFVGQRLRHTDYTKKTTELSQQRDQIQAQATQQITEYAQQLAGAQNKIQTIMTDLEKEQISAATANARLRKVKETYNLSDDDIPAVEGVKAPVGTAPTSTGTVDIDAKLTAFKNDLMKSLRDDMLAMPRISAIQSDIGAEHLELTGKRLSRTEMNELLDAAQKDRVRLEDAWEKKYGIPALRETKSDETKRSKWQSEWETEQKKKNSEAAMAGVRSTSAEESDFRSPVLGRKFKDSGDPVARPATEKSPVTPQPDANNGPRLSGAERAAAKFLERRANGVPMGQPSPA